MSTAVAIGLLAVISYGLRATGLLVSEDNPHINRLADPLTAAILASLILTTTVTSGTSIQLDARLVGLTVATIAALKKAPLSITLLLAVTATALARLLTI